MSTVSQNINRDDQTKYLGMIIALGSWTMLFITMLFGYTVLRLQAPSWYSFGIDEWPFIQAIINTLIIVISSAVYIKAVQLYRKNDHRFSRLVLITFGLGLLFLVLQCLLWATLTRDGITVQSDISGSLIYLLTGFHAVHIIGGLIALSWILFLYRKGKVVLKNSISVILVGWFWHFLTIVWIIFFLTIFVIH